jgi:hypothetical protein
VKIPFRQSDDRVVLHLLGAPDAPWVASVIDDAEAAVGHPWRVLLERWRVRPPSAHPARAKAIIAALRRNLGGKAVAVGSVSARKIRRAVLGAPVLDTVARAARIDAASTALAITPGEIEAGMWSDLAAERHVTMRHGRPMEQALCAEANLAIVQGALARAYKVRLELTGNPRPVLRIAALEGLIHTARRSNAVTVVDVSGPLSLFRNTTVYGRALGRLVPWLAWCEHFELRARCDLGRGDGVLSLRSPILLPPASRPRRFDSAVEVRFARDLSRATTAWRVQREPDVVPSGDHLLFPDFVLEHEHDAGRRWWIEIVGFWTTDYLAEKLARYRAAGLDHLILCIQATRQVADSDVPAGARVVRYQRHVAVEEILAIIDEKISPRTP